MRPQSADFYQIVVDCILGDVSLGSYYLGIRARTGYVGCEGLQEHHLYSRTNFKLNRDAALAEWRQLLSAQVQATPAIRCEFSLV